jgi:parallel beta-helix repeat protein
MRRAARVLVRVLASLLAVILAESAVAGAGKGIRVANNGTDSATCGSSTDPCRSISQAITNAPAGSRIVVGPGRYGDLNADGDFSDPGEEAAPSGCSCIILVDKPLRLESRDGAAVTVVDGAGAPRIVFAIASDDVTLGRRGRGFGITGGFHALRADGSHLRVEGNTAFGNEEDGFQLGLVHDAALVGNVAVANGRLGFWVVDRFSSELTFSANVALGNATTGFWIQGPQSRLVGNAASANGGGGFLIDLSDVAFVSGNVASANGSAGFDMRRSDPVTLQRNTAAGNMDDGIALLIGGGGAVTRNNLLGNGILSGSNCGIFNSWGPFPFGAERSYWGQASGPGADPADATCGPDVTLVDPVAPKEIKVKLKQLPLR